MNLTAERVAGMIMRAGGRGDGVVIGTAIVGRETGGTFDTRAFRPASRNPGGGNDRGIWQWNDKAHPDISDADAYDPERATAWAARKSAGFTNFGPWDIGPDAYSGNDKMSDLQSSAHWSRARAAAQNPDTRPVTGDGGDPAPTPLTPGEAALIRKYDVNGDGRVSPQDVQDYAEDTLDLDTLAELPEAHRDAIADVVEEYTDRGGVIRTGWLAAAKHAVGLNANQSFTPAYEAAVMMLLAWNSRADGGIIDSITGGIDAVLPDIPNPLEPLAAIAAAIGKIVGIITNPDWWRRIGIAVLGALMIAAAIFLTFSPAGKALGLARKVASET